MVTRRTLQSRSCASEGALIGAESSLATVRPRGRRLSRRALLNVGGQAALATLLATPLIEAACVGPLAPGTPATPGATAASGAVTFPSYVPLAATKPDLPPQQQGIDPGYYTYPQAPFKSVPEPPGRGGEVSIMTWSVSPPLAALDQNAAWQELNRQVGAKLNLSIFSSGDYQPTRLPVIMAGGDMPDILYTSTPSVQGFGQFAQAKCADLTPYLAGDAIKAYPNLAAVPTISWKVAVLNGALYGVPIPYSIFFRVLWVHQELLEQVGMGFPQNVDDFERALRAITNPQAGIWGIVGETGTALNVASQFQGMLFGAPNNWRVTDGKLVRDRETDEFKAAVAYVRDLWAAGVYHPDSPSYQNPAGKADFAARKFAFRWDGHSAAQQFWDTGARLQPPSKIRIVPPFAKAGATPTYPLGGGNFGFVVLKQGPPDRVKELLGILNFLAAPFGSQEHLLINYGVPQVDYTLDANGNPIPTDQGKADINPPGAGSSWTFVARPPEVIFDPNSRDFAQVLQADQAPLLAAGIEDPTYGLFSATNVAKGAAIEQPYTDTLTDIVLGRRPMDDYDQMVKDWQNAGGNQIRSEFEQALATVKA